MTTTHSADVVRGLPHLIDGALVEGDGEFPIVSPWTEQVIAVTPTAGPAEAEAAIAAARKAFDRGPWPRMLPSERSAALAEFARCLSARREDLVHIMIHQAGSVRALAETLQVDSALEAAHRYAAAAGALEQTDHFEIQGPPMSGQQGRQRLRLVQRVPAGVVSAITPFNYPFRVNVQKVFPALAVGFTVVLKPHPTTTWDAAVMADAAREAGLPDGVFNVLLGAGGEPAATWVR
jgi:aldehyde dehydrogenase (NAD+)